MNYLGWIALLSTIVVVIGQITVGGDDLLALLGLMAINTILLFFKGNKFLITDPFAWAAYLGWIVVGLYLIADNIIPFFNDPLEIGMMVIVFFAFGAIAQGIVLLGLVIHLVIQFFRKTKNRTPTPKAL